MGWRSASENDLHFLPLRPGLRARRVDVEARPFMVKEPAGRRVAKEDCSVMG